jgi:quercetin dioxygenase-like cupin family protein
MSGGRYTWKVSGAESEDTYAIIGAEVSPNAGPRLHLHRREYESLYVLAGTSEFRVGDQVIQLGPGSCVFGPRSIPRTCKNVGITPSRHLVTIAPVGFEKFLEALSASPAWPQDLEVLARVAAEYDLTFL